MYKKVLALALSLLFVFAMVALSACGGGSDGTKSETPGKSGIDDEKDYTLREYIGANPQNWNPHTWETNGDRYISDYAEMGFVDAIYDKENETFKWNFEMADDIKDVTANAADYDIDLADWDIDEEDTGRVWLYKLNKNAKWEDGTVINAATYEYSLKALLDPAMKNYRANNYFSGDAAIYGAFSYYSGGPAVSYKALGDAGYDFAEEAEDEDVFVDMWKFWGLDGEGCVDEEGNACPNFVNINDDTMYRDAAVTEGEDEDWVSAKYIFETYLAQDAVYAAYASTYLAVSIISVGDGTWDEVGFKVVDDYTFLYITLNTITQFYMNTAGTSNWIVYEELYEANKKDVGELVATTYGKSVDSYKSFGPYKLSSFEKDKEIVFERNLNWYGYSDDKHKGHYTTDKIICSVISDHNTELELFNTGKLDSVELTAEDMDTYRFADNLLRTEETYTYRFFFVTDKEVLETLSDNASSTSKRVNKVILAYDKFREAMSFAIDRADYAKKGTAGQKAALGLINSLYYYNVENDPDSIYRKSDEAKKVITDVYGIEYGEGKEYATLDEAYNAITGFDIEKARALFADVYAEAKAEGDLTDTDVFEFTCSVGANESLTDEQSIRNTLIQGYIDEATKDTPFEGKIKITYTTSPNRYDDVANGVNEMAMGAWGGASFYPFALIRVYTDPSHVNTIHEQCGFDPTTETVTIKLNGKDVTRTYQEWAISINPGGDNYSTTGDYSKMLTILAALEYNLIKGYHFIVLTSLATVSAYSNKIKYATTEYNIMYGYGGIRFLTYNYDDTGWDAYVSGGGKVYS